MVTSVARAMTSLSRLWFVLRISRHWSDSNCLSRMTPVPLRLANRCQRITHSDKLIVVSRLWFVLRMKEGHWFI